MSATPSYAVLLLVVGLLLLVVLAIALVGRKFGGLAAVVLASLLVLPFGLYVFVGLHVSHQQHAQVEELVMDQAMEAAQVQQAHWAEVDLQQFRADLYPGADAATEGLARRVRRLFDQNVEAAEKQTLAPTDSVAAEQTVEAAVAERLEITDPQSISVSMLQTGDTDLGGLHYFTEALKQQFPNSRVSMLQILGGDAPDSVPDESAMAIHLEHERLSPTTVDALHVDQPAGRILCHVRTATWHASESVEHIDKQWVDDLDAFVSAHPGRRLIVGYSGELVSSEAEAWRLAVENAGSACQLVINGRVVQPDESHVIDRFAQKLSRPYGDVWREAVLMDVSADRMFDQVQTAQRAAVHARSTRTAGFAGVVLLFGTALSICLILNWLTQGYYQGRLTAVASVALATAVGVAVVIMFLVTA